MSQAGAVQSSRGIQLDVGTLLARARQAAGLTDFGDEAFLEPLAHTVGIINAEARLRSDSELLGSVAQSATWPTGCGSSNT